MKKKMSKNKLIIIIGVVSVIAFFAYKNANKKEEVKKEISTTVLVKKAQTGSLKRFLDLYGELRAEKEVSLTSPVTGKVLRFNKLEGQTISRNEPVMSIDRFEVGARYAAAPILSPVTGMVTRILVSEGQDVTVGTPVATVGNIKKLEAIIQVPESSVPEVKIGQEVYFKTKAVPGTFVGKIIRKDLSLDPQTRALTVRAELLNPDNILFSGIFAESYIFVEEATNVFVVSESAVTYTKEGQTAVFVNENGIAKLKPVTIALSYKDQVAISEGISLDEEIVIFGREYLSDGSKIRVIYEDQDPTTTSVEQK